MKAVLIGQPEEVCADTIEKILYQKLDCRAVWNIHKLPDGFGSIVKIFASLPAVIMSDVAVLLPGYNKNWYTYSEYILAKCLFKTIISHEEIMPLEIKFDEKKHSWKISTQYLNYFSQVNTLDDSSENSKLFNKKVKV